LIAAINVTHARSPGWIALGLYRNKLSRDIARHEASRMKFVDALIKDAVLGLCLLHELKSVLDKYCTFM
jgi:hypothetical protein